MPMREPCEPSRDRRDGFRADVGDGGADPPVIPLDAEAARFRSRV
jgi:hypothetical protein